MPAATMLIVVAGVALVAALAALIYWLVIVTEGAYLGPRTVRFIYDWGAPTYDGVKGFDKLDEYMLIGRPLLDRIESTYGAGTLVLDIATGTGRLPIVLVDIPFFEGVVVGVDSSYEMLREAADKTANVVGRVQLLHGDAYPLPFVDCAFGAVTMMEALEFLPDRELALAEAARVLAPGGWLLITNRIGTEARLMPGRTESTEKFESRLAGLGFTETTTWPWQSYYDLIWARKDGETAGSTKSSDWRSGLRCPGCRAGGRWAVDEAPDQLMCADCGYLVAREAGIWRI